MTDSKTATERLREMLDARGVKWESKDVEGVKGFHDTRWQAMGVQWCYVEFVGNNYNKLKPAREFHCTPEQAIAATLGSGKCVLVYGEDEHGYDGWWCQSCGGWFAASFRHTGRDNLIVPRYCQHCGKVVKR